ncbi:hypothetical protein IQ07DRAFT_653228 [Pyrenochaeta sp. DS3sAY3a]|nr:hypothetical protein IQ07DRAFT_653228 [Pyrenochaeta sp. DS3sAY3a]
MDYSTLNPETLRALTALYAKMSKVRTAHAVLMSLAVVFWFPLGVVLLRLLKVKNTVRWHAIWQSFGLVLLIAGFGLGCWVSRKAGSSMESHVILGTILFVLFLIMPIIGSFHHRSFVSKGTRDYKRHIHVWGGRIILVLGFINGGTGLKLSEAGNAGYITYGVLSGIIGVLYVGVWYLKVRRAQTAIAGEETELRESANEGPQISK